jgi:hypothetical protein
MCQCKPDNELDPCLGMLNGVMNACCGHNNINQAYVQFLDGSTVRGEDAVIIQYILKHNSNDNLEIFDDIKDTKIKDFEIGKLKTETNRT